MDNKRIVTRKFYCRIYVFEVFFYIPYIACLNKIGRLMRDRYFQNRRPANAQASLRLSAVSLEHSLLAHIHKHMEVYSGQDQVLYLWHSLERRICALIKNEPVHEISNNVVCATSKASDQPAHTRSLIRAFASRLSIL